MKIFAISELGADERVFKYLNLNYKIFVINWINPLNYLSKDELENLGQIVNAYLELADSRAKRQIPMTMQDWAKRLDLFLQFDDSEILKNAGSISAAIAKEYAESEFEKYRIIQDKLFQSDFDKMIDKIDTKRINK